MRYILTFLEDVTLFDKANKGWLYKQGETWNDVSLLERVPLYNGYSSYILEAEIYGERRRVEISTQYVSLEPVKV